MNQALNLFLLKTQWAQIRSKVRNIRRVLALVAKVLCCLLLYIFVNSVLSVLVKMPNVMPPAATNLSALHEFLLHNLALATSFSLQYHCLLVSFVAMFAVVVLAVQFFVKRVEVAKQAPCSTFHRANVVEKGYAPVVSFRQHVAFLA